MEQSKNKLLEELSILEKSITHAEKSNVDLLSGKVKNKDYISNSISRNNAHIDKTNKKIKDVKQKIVDLKKGNEKIEKDKNEKVEKTIEIKKEYKNSFGMHKEYDRFRDFELPDYIQQNLREMTNNKGYIWKNIWCFGELPAEKDRYGKSKTVVMFEKQRDVMFIHEITTGEHLIFKKRGKDPREFVSSTQRKPLPKIII